MKAKTRILIQKDNFRHWNGRYAGMRQTAKRWSILVKICKSYAKQGLEYSTRIDLDGEQPMLIVEAHGEPVASKRREAKLKPYRDKGKPLTVKQCRKRTEESAGSLKLAKGAVSGHITRGLRKTPTYIHEPEYDHARRQKQRAIGHGLARIVAMSTRGGLKCGKPSKQDYAELAKLLGYPVMKLSRFRANDKRRGYWRYILEDFAGAQRPNYWPSTPTAKPTIEELLGAYREKKADLAFWRDVETLAEQREYCKPGPTTERTMDQELIAA